MGTSLARRVAPAVAAAAILSTLAMTSWHTGSAQAHVPAKLAANSPWLDRLNLWRAGTGVGGLVENATWSAGDYDHSQYMVMNDLVTHYETSGIPYYTSAGDTAARDGNIYVSSSTSTADTQAIDWWMGAPFHAMGLMDPRLTSTGFGSFRAVKSGWQMGATIDVLRGNSFTGGTWPVLFPGNGTTEPLTSYSGYEWPDPLQACPGYAMPTGLPIFVETGGNRATTVTAHSLSANGVQLANCVIDSHNSAVGSSLYYRGAAILIPRQPLQSGTTYSVSLTVNGVPDTWSFTVGPLSVCTVSDAPTPASPAHLGADVTFAASATGCAGTEFEFWVMAPGANLYVLAQPYSTSPNFTWKTAGIAPGTYAITVWAKGGSSSGTFGNASGRWDGYKYLQYTVMVGCPTVVNTPSVPAPVMPGTAITFTAASSGCASPQFEFWVLAPGTSLYTLVQPYSSAASFQWSTTGKPTGTYAVTVWVRDSTSPGGFGNSSGAWDAYNYQQYSLIAGCGSVSDAPSATSPATSGVNVTFTAHAVGCANPQYEFWVLAPGTSLYELAQPYGAKATFSWSTPGSPTGTYAVTVWVRDATSIGLYSNSSGSWDAYNYQQFALN